MSIEGLKYSDIKLKFNDLTNDELKNICRESAISGYSMLNHKDLISLIFKHYDVHYNMINNNYNYLSLIDICRKNKLYKQVIGSKGITKDLLIHVLISAVYIKNKIVKHCVIIDHKLKPTLIKSIIKQINKTVENCKHHRETIKEKETILNITTIENKKQEDNLPPQYEATISNNQPKKRKPLPACVRFNVWNHYIGEDINKHLCLCCKKGLITYREFQVGHVISVRDGGTDEINNLRPICAPCNHSMGCKNMIEFVKTYGYYIG